MGTAIPFTLAWCKKSCLPPASKVLGRYCFHRCVSVYKGEGYPRALVSDPRSFPVGVPKVSRPRFFLGEAVPCPDLGCGGRDTPGLWSLVLSGYPVLTLARGREYPSQVLGQGSPDQDRVPPGARTITG